MLPITIRPARPSDIEPLRLLNTQILEDINQRCDGDLIHQFAQTKVGLKWMTDMVNRNQDGFVFVAEHDGRLVGYVSGQKLEYIYRKSRWFEIDNLGVIEELRGKGLGKQLLDKALSWGKDHGFQKVNLTCYAENKLGCDFYLTQGFSEVDIVFEKNL